MRSGFILLVENQHETRNGGIANIVSTGNGRDFRWRGGGIGREDEQRQDRKRMISTLRWCASARTAYSSSTLSSSCHPLGASGTTTHSSFVTLLSEICLVIEWTIGWSRPRSLEYGHYYTRDKTMWATTSRYRNFIFLRRNFLPKVQSNVEDIAHFSAEDRITIRLIK